MATVIEGLAELHASVGKDLGASGWHEMKFEDILAFAQATGDRQWIHVDRERCARESPYKTPIAHGMFTLSLIPGLYFEVLEVRGFSLVLNYGLNKVRFPAPLREGARYRLAMKMGEVKDLPGGAEVLVHGAIEIEGEAKPACAAELVFRYLNR
jgi:acyl dehydratase